MSLLETFAPEEVRREKERRMDQLAESIAKSAMDMGWTVDELAYLTQRAIFKARLMHQEAELLAMKGKSISK